MRRDVFQAIADPTRREIISLIAQQSLAPNVVAESFPVSRQAISKHLKILTQCGILSLEVSGREHYYSVRPQKLAEIHAWIEQFHYMWEKRFNQLDQLLLNENNSTGDSRVARYARNKNKK